MKKTLFPILLTGVVAVSFLAQPIQAAEESKEKAESTDTKKKGSSAFLNRWKKIQTVTKKKAYETQQTRTVAGVRGAEAEDAILDQLYYKGGVRYPSRVDLKNAISQLQESITAEPDSEGVPEMKMFIGQCHVQLGEFDEAKGIYNDLIENYSDTEFAGQAKTELGKLTQ